MTLQDSSETWHRGSVRLLAQPSVWLVAILVSTTAGCGFLTNAAPEDPSPTATAPASTPPEVATDIDAPTTTEADEPPDEDTPTSAPPTVTETESTQALYRRVHSGVGQVLVQTCEGESWGTAFLISPDALVTAAHVVQGATEVIVALRDGTEELATVVGVDFPRDIALLELDSPISDAYVFTLSEDDPEIGEELITIGYPQHDNQSLLTGVVSTERLAARELRDGWFREVFQTTVALNPGNSGGPLLRGNAEVVGIASFRNVTADAMSYAVVAASVEQDLIDQTNLEIPGPPWCAVDASAEEKGVRRALDTYFAAINDRDYWTAMSQVTDDFQERVFPRSDEWYAGYQSSHADRIHIHQVSTAEPETATARLSFRSQQAPGYGPAGADDAPCLMWEFDYHFVLEGDSWLLDEVTELNDPPWQFCT